MLVYVATPCREDERRMCPIQHPCERTCLRFGITTHNPKVARIWVTHYKILVSPKNKIDRSYLA